MKLSAKAEREARDLSVDLGRRVRALIEASPYAIGITSAWRSYAEQKRLYDGWKAYQAYLNGVGPKVPKFNPANPPGRSKHEAVSADGLPASEACDLSYPGGAKAVAWAHEHAADFGLHFPIARENWHAESNGEPYDPPEEDDVALSDDDKKWLTAMVDKRIALVIRGDKTHPDNLKAVREELAALAAKKETP